MDSLRNKAIMAKENSESVFFVDGDNLLDQVPIGADIYSSEGSIGEGHSKIKLSEESTTRINHEVWNEVVDYYNLHRSIFEKFQESEGFNLWFSLNFRLYFELRNFRLKIVTVQKFLSRFPEGRVVTSDNRLSMEIDNASVILVVKAGKNQMLKRLIKMFKELLQIMSSRRVINKNKSDTLIISNLFDHNGMINKRFHSLESVYDQIAVRDIFAINEPNKQLSEWYKKSINADWIVKDYLGTIGFFKHQRKFNKWGEYFAI